MPQPDPACNMTYHNGPVVQTNTTYIVYWEPPGSGGVSTNYHSLIQRYLSDVAADSNRATNVYAIATQYYDNTGSGGSNKFLQYSQTFGGSFTDTNAFPATLTGCPTTDGTNTVANCLTQTQESTELDNFVQAHGLPRGLTNLYFLVLPKGVETCYDNFSQCGNLLNTSPRYCAYHSSFNLNSHGLTIWANEPYIGVSLGHCASGTAPSPNGDDADHELNELSHEHNEIITDPTSGGWFDVGNTGETGDKCNFNFAANIGSTASGGYDQVINHNPYEIQQEWSNAITGCAPTYGAVAPGASFNFSPSSPQISDSVNFDGSASHSNDTGGNIISYSWDFGDGTTATSTSLSGASPTTSHTYSSAGTHTVTLTVEDDAGMTATTTRDVTVVKRATSLSYTGPKSGDFNDPVTLSATLTDTSSSAGIANETIVITLGTQSCTSGLTDASGHASCSITLNQAPGNSYTGTASFGGDTVYAASSSASQPFTINQEESQLTYTGATTVHYHDVFTASARLTDPDGGAPIGGKMITFTLGSGDTCTTTVPTDSSGNASCSITPTQTGPQQIVASFAGDANYVSSSDTQSFSITPEETTMTYTGPTVILAGKSGVTLTAKMVEDGSADNDGDGGSPAPNPTETVTLAIGAQTCTGTTDSSGNVSCTIPSVTVPLGPEVVGAVFAGDAHYAASSDSQTAIVFAFPSRGAFTLGDKTVATATSTTTVTFWADTWSTLNSLSGGSAPPAFKGFAGTVSLPTTTPPGVCGGNWTTNGGNSPPPASGIPSYMGTLVTSKVTKTGTGIAGNTVKIVVVKTNSGYQPSPIDHGTGTIAATYC